MLKSFTIRGFKSVADATIRFEPVTFLIGANASGKSNVLEGLALLSWLASGGRLAHLRGDMRDGRLDIRGPLGRDTVECSFACVISAEPGEPELTLDIGLHISDDRNFIAHEKLFDPDDARRTPVPLYEVKGHTHEGGRDLQVAYDNFKRGGVKPQIICADEQPVFTQLLTPARFAEKHAESQTRIPSAVRRVVDALEAILFLDPSPRRMREYSHRSERTLTRDGRTLSSVLRWLVEDRGQREAVLAFVRSLPEQNIRDIEFHDTGRDEVMVRLVESFGGSETRCDASLLSDGTLRVLAIAAALYSVAEGTTVVIEEVDNGVHPSRVASLLERITATARQRGLRILLTTHNAATLDSIANTLIPMVTVCYRNPLTGGTELKRFEDFHFYPELAAQGHLGHVVSRGLLERSIRSVETDAERRAQTARWLDRFFVDERGSE